MKVDVIVTGGTQATRAAKQATTSIPIVMATSGYPDKLGLVQSLARPGGNVTGQSNVSSELQGKRAELMREIAPSVSRVAVLWNPASPAEALGIQEIFAGYGALGIGTHSIEVRTPEDHPAAFAAVTANRADALHILANPVSFKGVQLITEFALRNRLPGCFEERTFVEAGGLFSYASSFAEAFRRAATYVDKILKGAKPADLPIQQPTTFELVINAKTAQALGLTVPKTLLLRADEVIR